MFLVRRQDNFDNVLCQPHPLYLNFPKRDTSVPKHRVQLEIFGDL